MSGYTVRTIRRPAGAGWRRCPSVTYGGAPSFWTRRNPDTDAREWVAYDRIARSWTHRVETPTGETVAPMP